MGKKGKKPKAVTETKEYPLFRTDTFVLNGDGSKVMAASGSVDANLRDSTSVDSTFVSCNNIEVNVSNGGIVIAGGVCHNGNFAADRNPSREAGGEMKMAAGFASTDTDGEEMAPGLENDASCEIVASGLENDASCEIVASGLENDASCEIVAPGLKNDAGCEIVAPGSEIDAKCEIVASSSEIHASLKGVAVGTAATDDSISHSKLADSKPGLRLNLNNIEVNIQSGSNVHIGGVYHNSTFYAGGTSSGSNVAMSSGSASEYADLERMVTGSEAAQLRRLLDLCGWNNSGALLNRNNIKVDVASGCTVNIGCVYYNTNFVTGDKPSRPMVACESSRAPQRSSGAAANAPTRPLENRPNAPAGPSPRKQGS